MRAPLKAYRGVAVAAAAAEHIEQPSIIYLLYARTQTRARAEMNTHSATLAYADRKPPPPPNPFPSAGAGVCVYVAHTLRHLGAQTGGGDDDSSPSPPATHMRVLNGDSS